VSYSVDVNILLYASDQTSERHERAARFLAMRASDPELFCVTWLTLMAYVRIATHPRVFAHPLAPADAVANVAALLALSRVRVLGEGDDFLDAYREVTGRIPVRGNLVPDAHLATILRQHDVRTLYTNDADFTKFDFLDIRDPLA
jgi:toxin-antitoxin system PIN domain toxin